MNALVKYVITLLVSIPFIVFHGFVFQTLWNWFVTDLGVVSISFLTALGIAFTINLLVTQTPSLYQVIQEDEKFNYIEQIGFKLIFSLMVTSQALLLGTIVNALG